MLATPHRLAIASGVVGTAMAATVLVGLQAGGAEAALESTGSSAPTYRIAPPAGAPPTGVSAPWLVMPRLAALLIAARPAPAPAPAAVVPTPGRKVVELFGARGPNWMVAHSGIDFKTNIGTPIHAAFNGKIRSVFAHRAYGNVVELKRADGVVVWYCHLSRPMVFAGQAVTQNQVVGLTGATGNVTGPHLHVEVRVNHIPTDPTQFFFLTPGKPAQSPKWAAAYLEEPPAGTHMSLEAR